jgi:hypothetical protein
MIVTLSPYGEAVIRRDDPSAANDTVAVIPQWPGCCQSGDYGCPEGESPVQFAQRLVVGIAAGTAAYRWTRFGDICAGGSTGKRRVLYADYADAPHGASLYPLR